MNIHTNHLYYTHASHETKKKCGINIYTPSFGADKIFCSRFRRVGYKCIFITLFLDQNKKRRVEK